MTTLELIKKSPGKFFASLMFWIVLGFILTWFALST